MNKVSMSYLFSFSRYQTKCFIDFLFRQLMTSHTLRFVFDHPQKQWPTGRKRGKDRNRKNWEISWERKELFVEIKSIFHSFSRAIIWWKNKNLMKIVDTSFKFRKKTSMPNPAKSLDYIKCYSSSSPRPVKSPSNSIRNNSKKICSWSRRPKPILEIAKKVTFL